MMQKYYKDWLLFETMPEGWKIDKTCGSPLAGYEFISDGKSPINGGRRALVRIEKPIASIPAPERGGDEVPISNQEKTKSQQPYPARSVNELARQRFKLKMLADIRCDIMICEIEGWGKSEYLDEIKKTH